MVPATIGASPAASFRARWGMKLGRAGRWLLEGLGVAACAAGLFLIPWLWVKIFPPPGPYTLPAIHRIGPRLPVYEPLRYVPKQITAPRSRLPSPLPPDKLIFIDLRSRPQTLTAYEDDRPIMRYRVSGSRMGTDDVGRCRVRRKARRHWYAPDGYWMEWWMTIEPLTPEGRERAFARGYNGIHATSPRSYPLLGRPASHGCVRMRASHARKLWEWAEIGTPIYIYRYESQRGSLPAPARDTPAA